MNKRKNLILFFICFTIETCIIFYCLNYYNRNGDTYNEDAYQYLEDIAKKMESSKINVLSLPENVSKKISTDGSIVYVTLRYDEQKKHQTYFEELCSSLSRASLFLIYDSKGTLITMKRDVESREILKEFLYSYSIVYGFFVTILTWIFLFFLKLTLKSVFQR